MKIKSEKFGTRPFPSKYDVVRIATLNKTDLSGGNNKFYVIEAHVADNNGSSQYRLYSRYGRVGAHGVEEERWPAQNRAALDEAFDSLLGEKTSKRKGYVEVKLAQTSVGSSVANTQVLSDDVKKDKLVTEDSDKAAPTITIDAVTAKLVDRLFTEAGQAVRAQLSGTLGTSTKNPLGTLTLGQIHEGERIIGLIQALLAKKPSLVDSIDRRVLDLSNQFYSAIPQVMDKRPTTRQGKAAMDTWLKGMALNNAKILDDKQELLELLSDVEGLVSGFATNDAAKRYQEIGCKYEVVDRGDPSWKRVNDYVQGARGSNHNWGCKVVNLWRLNVKGQERHVKTMKEVGNVKPLFHGSRPANILGICKHGLLLRPPGAIVTGSMFGNGLYFADSSSKSEQYSFGRFGGGSGRGNTYFMFVADVALGKIKEYLSAQMSLTRPPRGYDSVMGKKGPNLYHNEFIIYTLSQHILQYLIEFQTSNRGYY